MHLMYLFIVLSIICSAPLDHYISSNNDNIIYNRDIGDYPYPSDPMQDRAIGLAINGKAKTSVSNNGRIINWDYQPSGLWGNYTYIPNLSFIAGIPGHAYSSDYTWTNCTDDLDEIMGTSYTLWCSSDAYDHWFDDLDERFRTVVFNTENDRADIGGHVLNKLSIADEEQWGMEENEIFICVDSELDPNSSSARIGLAYPWSIRPRLSERIDEFDVYDYGNDNAEWTEDDDYMYFGANTIESWFTRISNESNADWQPSTGARIYTHNSEATLSDIFGETIFIGANNVYPILAHSNYPDTWPTEYNPETGEDQIFWPGQFSEKYYGDQPDLWNELGITNCSGLPQDDDCWIEEDHFISDSDIYMEFDDRWAHRGSAVENNEYHSAGYPLGIKVRSQVHSYGIPMAEDILFFTTNIQNESGDFIDSNGTLVDGMIMPDGTKLNSGLGFDYHKMHLGFYLDADVLTADIFGNFGVHTNSDDFMEYYTESFEINGQQMKIDLAMIYDYDGMSASANSDEIGIVAIQILDTPLANEAIDLNGDGFIDIYPGEKLGMTDWHWFDWYNRPGVLDRESNSNCCDGSANRPGAMNKELIQYQVLSGDTTNLSEDEKSWFFHTPYPESDLDIFLNPHFDSLDGLEEIAADQTPQGLDCVFQMGSGPFSLDVGEKVPFSFAVIFGENQEDLINNAKIAQIMHTNHYQIFSAPTVPIANILSTENGITISWDNSAEESTDLLTGLNDFEGYKIYRSIDGRQTWGDEIYNEDGNLVGWEPYAQFDLTEEEDIDKFGSDISGPDPAAPWVNLGNNTGLAYELVDTDVIPTTEYCYYVTAYDTGYSPSEGTQGWELIYGEFGIPSMQSGVEIICASPSSSDIYTPPTSELFIKNELNIGSAEINFIAYNSGMILEDMEAEKKYMLEVNADQNNPLNQNYPLPLAYTQNPRLYVWEVNGNDEPISLQPSAIITSELIDSMSQLPGIDILDSSSESLSYQLPQYVIENFSLLSESDENYTENWIELSGLFLRIDNRPTTNASDKLILLDVEWYNEAVYDDITFDFYWGNNGGSLIKQYYYDYMIKFNSERLYEVDNTIPSSGCTDSESFVPFKIFNMSTHKDVGLWHVDKGSKNIEDTDNCSALCLADEWCNNGICEVIEGYGDCIWQYNELIAFKGDTIQTVNDPDGDNEYTFDLIIDWDGVSEDNIFPWSTGDSVKISPRRILHDGDKWLLDMEQFKQVDLSNGDIEHQIPVSYHLSKPYPNPFNPVTNLSFRVPVYSNVIISVYDMVGREVDILYNDLASPQNNHNLTWDGSQYSSGVYFVQMKTNNFFKSEKIVLIK